MLILCIAFMSFAASSAEIKINADKIALKANEEQVFKVTCNSNNAFTGQLKVFVEYNICDRALVTEKEISLKSNIKQDILLKWTPKENLWGANGVAELWENGKLTASDKYTFTVSDNLPMASSTMGTLHTLGDGSEKNLKYLKEKAKEFADSGISIVELFSWTPDLWGKNVNPQTETWNAGQGNFPASVQSVKAFIEYAHAHGIKVYSYAQPCFSGKIGEEYAESHPDYLLYRTPDGKINKKGAAFRCYANILNKACLDEGIDSYSEVIKRFNFDGIRWDGHPGLFYTPINDWVSRCNGQPAAYPYDSKGKPIILTEPDNANTNIVKYITQRMDKEKKDLLCGYNICAGTPEELTFNTQFPSMFKEITTGNLLLQERHFHTNKDGRPYISYNQKWSSIVNDLVYSSDLIHTLGGYLYRGDFGMGRSEPFLKQVFAFHFAAGARLFAVNPWYKSPNNPTVGLFPCEYTRFALRFNKYLFNPALYRFNVSKPLQRISVSTTAPFPIIYDKFCYDLFQDKKLITVVHLINTPVSDQVNVNNTSAPSWVTDKTVVSVRTPMGVNSKKAKYYVLSPEWKIQLAPVEVENPAKPVINVEVPNFQYWAMVICEYELGTDGKPVSSEDELFLPVLHRKSDPL